MGVGILAGIEDGKRQIMGHMRIPITMCHGVRTKREMILDAARFRRYFEIAARLGFESISYDDLAIWKFEGGRLPERPILFDFDHPVRSMHDVLFPLMAEFGYRGNLFINTEPLTVMYASGGDHDVGREYMIWEEICALSENGWHIGAHTHTHPNLSDLCTEDPTGEAVARELDLNNEILEKHLGFRPMDFAFTGSSWSSIAEREVKKRYRFGRLWITEKMYSADGVPIRYSDLVGVPGDDFADGGPPTVARYITEMSDPYRLPSMEIQCPLIYDFGAFEDYLAGALEDT